MADQPSITVGEEPVATREEWHQETEELLPRRPRRRLIGAGGNPLALALLGVLLGTCGFIGGVLVEKGETSSGSSGSAASSLASRFRALRTGAAGASASGSSAGGTAGSASTGFTRPTAGTVAYVNGGTVYVTNPEGNTIKVKTSAATSVTKTVKASVKGIRPGEAVTVTGGVGANGAVSAESITVGAGGGVLGALFGAGGTAGAGGRGAGSSRGEPSLFGS